MKVKSTSKKFSRREFISNSSLLAGCLIVPAYSNSFASGDHKNETNERLNVKKEGNIFIIETQSFAFCLDTTDGLKALWWHNKLSGRKLSMGKGDEIEFTIGLQDSKIIKPKLKIINSPKSGSHPLNEIVFVLNGEEVNAKVTVTYSWNGTEPVLGKVVNLINEGTTKWNRLLDIHLGTYSTDAVPFKDPDWPVLVTKSPWQNAELDYWEEPAGSAQGYPSYLENQFFVGLAHPSGFSLLKGQKLELHHHPGTIIEPGSEFTSVLAVYGVAEKDQARATFKRYIYSRMRRVLRGHDHPYAIIDTCGAQNNTGEKFDGVTEEWCKGHISKLAYAQSEAGLHFDNYVIEFWQDPKGDLKECDPKRFTNNFDKITLELNNIGTNLGLWIDSGYSSNIPSWTIGDNPVLYDCRTLDGTNTICRSTPPANQMYIDAFIHHIRTNHVRQIKLDNGGAGINNMPICNNSRHKHLPGVYSVETNHNAQIELLSALNKECPEVFLTLYWGHQSPWWLMYADTVYDIGFRMEMASLALPPALFGRSSNVRRLDQGKYMAAKDYPDLAWDSLGIALSDWVWNNRMGSDRWQEGVLMDICRGSMLLHIWSDNDCIPVNDRHQMAEFINLLKASPDCFRNPHAIGNPFKDNWWGYCCTNGKKAMIAIDNGCWEDQLVTLELNSLWGLPDDVEWDIYCWYPNHVKFKSTTGNSIGAKEKISIRPFTAMLLEVIPKGYKPSLQNDHWKNEFIQVKFSENSRNLEIATDLNKTEKGTDFTVTGKLPKIKGEGWLALTTEFMNAGKPFQSLNNKPLSKNGDLDGNRVEFEIALDNPFFPAPWQTYRLKVNKASSEKEFKLSCKTELKKEVDLIVRAHFIPIDSEV